MAEAIGEHNIHEYLTAFADGELDASAILSVLDYLETHPEGLQLMRNQQRLRLAAERAVRTDTPPVPGTLRRRVESLAAAAATPAPAPAAGVPRPRSRPGRWRLPAVAAASLLAGLLVGRSVLAPGPATRVVVAPTAAEPVVPATLVVHASRVHADCSRLTSGLHTAGYPKALGGLRRAVQDDMGGADPYPNFSAIGFEFVGAGPCAAPLADTVHLLYRARGRDGHEAISVFVQLNTGQFQLQADKLYLVSGPRSAFPMFAWRTDSVVFFLLGDDLDTAEKARDLIVGAPRRPAV